jgi:dTDP-glucose pyrophosphorylase
VLQKVDSAGTRAAVVVDRHDQFVGLLTDGDARRAILSGASLDDEVDTFVNRSAFALDESVDNPSIRKFMAERGIVVLPILNLERQVVNVYFRYGFESRPIYPNLAVIMVGGLGTRLRPLTDKLPKPMIEVGGKPILERILEGLRSEGIVKIVLAVGYKSEIIKEYFGNGDAWDLNITYVEEDVPLGTAGALGLLDPSPDQHFLVMNGDVLHGIGLHRVLDEATKDDVDFLVVGRRHETQLSYGVLDVSGGLVTRIVEKPTYVSLINTGIYVCHPRVLANLPKSIPVSMTDFIDHLIKMQFQVAVFESDDPWVDVGRFDELQYVQRLESFDERT